MKEESRTYKTYLNARVSLFFTIFSFIIAFFSRKIFLNSLGVEFIGLTSTLQSVLGFINLAELGVGTAISVTLFKPLKNNNIIEINEIMTLMSYLYKRIGIVVLFIGVFFSIFLPYIFPEMKDSLGLLYFSFYTFLCSSLFTYFFNYRQILLSADQKNYVVTKYLQFSNIIKLLLQMYFAYEFANPFIWIFIELIFSVPYCLILNYKIRKSYPWLQTNIYKYDYLVKKYPIVAKHIKNLFIQKIAVFFQSQITPIFINLFVSLVSVAYYTNYITITSKLSLILNALLGSTEASIGNLIAEGNKTKIYNVYKQMISLRFFFAGFFVTILFFFIEPFISIWLGKEYIMSKWILVLILLDLFISHFRGATDQFLYGYGLFKDVWSAIFQVFIFIVFVIFLGEKYQLCGILLAILISKVPVVVFWKPYFLFKNGFSISYMLYWGLFFKNIFIHIISFCFCYYINCFFPINNSSYIYILIDSLFYIVIYFFISGILMYIFLSEFRDIICRFKMKGI